MKSQAFKQTLLCYHTCGHQYIAFPNDVYVFIQKNLWYVNLHDKRDFANVIKVLDLEMGVKIPLACLSGSNAI